MKNVNKSMKQKLQLWWWHKPKFQWILDTLVPCMVHFSNQIIECLMITMFSQIRLFRFFFQ